MKNLILCCLVLWGFLQTQAGDLVEVTATLVPVEENAADHNTQLGLHQMVTLAKSRGARELLKLSALVESGKWATVKRGREFWYPGGYSDAVVHASPSDSSTYSIPRGAPAPGRTTIVIPNSPTRMQSTELGARLRVRPTVKEDGLIYLEGQFGDTVFEGLSQEVIPINIRTQQLVRGNRETELMTSRIDKPVFRTVEKPFEVMLPYGAGSSVNAIRLREAKETYNYFAPVTLGNTAFGVPGKIELKEEGKAGGVIAATMMKAPIFVKDLLVRKPSEPSSEKYGILILEIRKVTPPEAKPILPDTDRIYVTTKIIESESPRPFSRPLLSEAEVEEELREVNSQQGTDLLSAPSIVISPGQKGKVEVIREFIFPSEYSSPSLVEKTDKSLPVSPATPVSFQTKNVGVAFEINGEFEGEDAIRLRFRFTELTFEGFLDFGNQILGVKEGMMKKINTTVLSENRVDMPVFPFRSLETELIIPNGSTAAITAVFDYHNKDHHQNRLIPFTREKIKEVETPRYLTLLVTPRSLQ